MALYLKLISVKVCEKIFSKSGVMPPYVKLSNLEDPGKIMKNTVYKASSGTVDKIYSKLILGFFKYKTELFIYLFIYLYFYSFILLNLQIGESTSFDTKIHLHHIILHCNFIYIA